MAVLFFTFLKIDISKLRILNKKLKVIILTLILHLIILPLTVFFVLKILNVENYLILSLLLFASVPAGVASVSITDILDGDTILSTAIVILTHLIAPITIPLLFFILLRKIIQIDYLHISIILIKLIFIPLIAAQIFKNVFVSAANTISKNNKIITTTILLILGTTVTAINYNYIMDYPLQAVKYILMSIPIYLSFIIIPFYLTKGLKPEERISIFATKAFMNVTIGVVLAISILDEKASLVLTLAQIPWSLMIFPAQLFIRLNKIK